MRSAMSVYLARGQTAAILGPNGKGKTTLLKSIIGLHPLAEGTAKTAGRVGYVAQKNDMSFAYKVLDLLSWGGRHMSDCSGCRVTRITRLPVLRFIDLG